MRRSIAAASVIVALAHGDPDKEAKLAAVNKVIKMLEDLQTECVEEGTKEAKSYDTFACYCKETTKDKADAIQTGEDEKDRLESQSKDLAEKRDGLDEKIQKLEEEIEETEKEMKEAQEKRDEEKSVYDKNEADLAGAISALEGAIKMMKASKNPELIQTGDLGRKLREVAAIADALGLGGIKATRALALLQRQEAKVPDETYSYHSDDIIKMLKELETEFKAEKEQVDSDEEKAVKAHKKFMKKKKQIVEDKTTQRTDKKKKRAETVEKIARTSEELTASVATLYDDQEYMTTVSKMCSERAQTWDQRSKVRADEINALTAAIAIMKDKVKEKTSAATVRLAQQVVNVNYAIARVHNQAALEQFEAEAETVEGTNFMQLQGTSRRVFLKLAGKPRPGDDDASRQAVIELLKIKGDKLKSTLLTSLASQLAKDPFAKIKVLIQELIQRLLSEAGSEANQKGFCDKAMSDAKQKRDYAAEEIEALNAQLAEGEARRDTLTEDLDVLAKEIEELDERQTEATKNRKEEKSENKATVEEAGAGLEAVQEAIDILDKFYKTAAKSEVKLKLLQGPEDDAPDAGFDSGEAYTGAGGSGGGIIGMLEVIESDFKRTVKVTKDAEKKSSKEYNDFMTESGKSLAEKKMAEKLKKKQLNDTEEKLDENNDSLDSQTEKLQTSIEELLELKPTCVDTGMSYEERVAMREDEVEALKKALCIFENFKDGADAASNC